MRKSITLKVAGIALLIVAVYSCFCDWWHPSIKLGRLRWVYLGNNDSVIRYSGKDIIGPGAIELHVSSNLVYGIFETLDQSSDGWFAICTETGKTYVDEPLELERRLVRDGIVRDDFTLEGPYYTHITLRRILAGKESFR